MSKTQGQVVTYQRNGVAIQALVAFSRQVILPAGATEHLTVVYLDPAAASIAPTGEQLRNSIKVQNDVPPLTEDAVNGWADADRISGSPREVVEAQFGKASEEIARLRKDLADSENESKAKDVTILNLEQQISDAAGLPADASPESMAAQDEHDHATGNVNEKGQTPNEAVQAEQTPAVPSVGIGQPAK